MKMSRSKRKTSIIGSAVNNSEKKDKQAYNRRYRRIFKQCLHINPLADVFPHLKEHSNSRSMAKDGKKYFDKYKHPKLMRK